MRINQKTWILIFGFGLYSCISNKVMWVYEENIVKIISIDSLKFVNYYVVKFETKKELRGQLLIDKGNTNQNSIDLLKSKKLYFDELCDVNEFKFNNGITYRGHATNGKIYENEKLIIDLRNELANRYYQFCHINLNKRKLRGNISIESEPLIGATILESGTLNGTLTDIDGDFNLSIESNKTTKLTVNPCCTCYNSTEITIEKNVIELLVNCDCKNSKVIMKKKYFEEGLIKTKVLRQKIK